MNNLIMREESLWKKRAKRFWLKDEDLNTRFFHVSAMSRAKVIRLSKLKSNDGVVVENQAQIKEVACGYSQNLFTHRDGHYDLVLEALSPSITNDDNTFLLKPFVKEEFKNTLSDMHYDKALSPNGFNLDFMRDFVSSMVMRFLQSASFS